MTTGDRYTLNTHYNSLGITENATGNTMCSIDKDGYHGPVHLTRLHLGAHYVDAFSTDGTFASTSDHTLATQQAIKTYVDSKAGDPFVMDNVTLSSTTGATEDTLNIAPNTALIANTTLELNGKAAISVDNTTDELTIVPAGGMTNITGEVEISGDTAITSATASTVYTTGALLVTGGVGVGGNVYANGRFDTASTIRATDRITAQSNEESTLTTNGALVVGGGVGVGLRLNVGGAVSTAGILTCTNATASTAPNNGAVVVTGGVGVGDGLSVDGDTWLSGDSLISSATVSTTTATGALVVTGGVGIGGNVFIGGTTNSAGVTTVSNTTDSTTSTDGALIVSGGAGIAKMLYVGDDVHADNYHFNSLVAPLIKHDFQLMQASSTLHDTTAPYGYELVNDGADHLVTFTATVPSQWRTQSSIGIYVVLAGDGSAAGTVRINTSVGYYDLTLLGNLVALSSTGIDLSIAATAQTKCIQTFDLDMTGITTHLMLSGQFTRNSGHGNDDYTGDIFVQKVFMMVKCGQAGETGDPV